MAGSAGWAARDQGEERLKRHQNLQMGRKVHEEIHLPVRVRLALGGWKGAKLSYSYSSAVIE